MKSSSVHVIILIVFSFILYTPLSKHNLWDSAELRYAEVAKETFDRGHWVVPYYNGEVYYNKPPLFFCIVALLGKLTGQVTELTAQLPSVLSASGTVVITYLLGKNLFGPRVGLLAALILACSPKFQHYARSIRLDTMNTLFITSVMASFYYGYTYKQRPYLLFAGFAMGLAILNKGPLILYPLMTCIIFYLVYCRDLKFLLSKDFFLSAIVLLLTVFAWVFLACAEGGSNYFNGFWEENITEYVAKRRNHPEAIYGYLGDMFIGDAPWSFFFLLVLYNYFKDGKRRMEVTFPLIWVIVMFLCFCITLTRRSPYLLLIYPPLSILVAHFFDARMSSLRQACQPRVYALVLYSIAVAVGLLTGKVVNNPIVSSQYVLVTTLVSITFFVMAVVLSLRSQSLHLFFISSLISLSVCAISENFYFSPEIGKSLSTKTLCKEIRSLAGPGTTLGVYRETAQYYSFYIINVKHIATEKDLIKFLDSSERAYCLISRKDYQSLKKNTTSYQTKELMSDKGHLLIFNKKMRKAS